MVSGIFFHFSLAATLVHGVVITKTNTAIICPTEKWNQTTAACTTQLGLSASISVPTAIATTTRELPPIVILSTSVSVATTTLNASTNVETSTVTVGTNITETALTNTVLSTSSVFDTLTVLETTTLTSTIVSSTTVTTTSTSTIAAPSGFLPIDDTTFSIYPSPVPTINKRDISFPRSSPHNHEYHGIIRDLYAISVTCVTIVDVRGTKTIVIPGSTSITTVTPPAVSTTLFTTTTSTSTFVPQNMSTTIDFTTTISATTTLTLTTSTTVTTTSTFYATETITTYAACSASNLLGPQTSDGLYINNIFNQGPDSASLFTTMQANSAYDCCVSCIDNPSCSVSGYGEGTCYILNNLQNACESQGAYPAFYTTAQSGPGLTLSNGKCGFLYRDG